MLSSLLDVFRLRQYFNVITRVRELGTGLQEDAGLLDDARRALVRLPFEAGPPVPEVVFPPPEPFRAPALRGSRVALAATGGSGALVSIIGVARALEECGTPVAALSLCSGSALFGFPLAAGLGAEAAARLVLGLRPEDYVDVDWPLLARLVPSRAKGFAGIIKGDRLERTYRRLLGDMTLGELPIPAYAPIWNVEHNRLEYLGPRTHPDVPVARAVRMAVSLPLFIEPAVLDGQSWCDGGIVDIFPVRPLLDIEPTPDVVVAVNGFYPPEFAGEDASGWEDRAGSILYVASQIRTCQQVELARENLARLRRSASVIMLEPVPYAAVRGVGFYRQFLSTRDWAGFMTAGRAEARRALAAAPRRRTKPATAVAS